MRCTERVLSALHQENSTIGNVVHINSELTVDSGVPDSTVRSRISYYEHGKKNYSRNVTT